MLPHIISLDNFHGYPFGASVPWADALNLNWFMTSTPDFALSLEKRNEHRNLQREYVETYPAGRALVAKAISNSFSVACWGH